MERRDFLISTAMAAIAMRVPPLGEIASAAPPGQPRRFNATDYIHEIAQPTASRASRRPPITERRFVSEAVEKRLRDIKAKIADPELAWMFENCYPNPLDTTVEFRMTNGRPDTFVLTGDIPAMWPRDTLFQMLPFLPLVPHDPHLRLMIQGVINRMVDCLLLSPYANAYCRNAQQPTPFAHDRTHMVPGVWEHKWELDTPCALIKMSYEYWKVTGDVSAFDARWRKAMEKIVSIFKEQQRLDGPGPYHFQMFTTRATDTLPRSGYGFPARPVGLIYTMFRASDDAVIYPLHIPDNMFAATVLRQLSEVYHAMDGESAQFLSTLKFSQMLANLARDLGTRRQNIFAYEIDGFGNAVFMDDAAWPGLLSLPYLGACDRNDPTYQATRKLIWSTENPYFVKGKFESIGSVHVSGDNVWPLSLIMYGLTATDAREVAWSLRSLKLGSAGTGFVHESFNKNDSTRFTRPWFAWANAMFGELIVQTAENYPHVLAEKL